ncbi:biopolymer transporter ExbD [candidate division KSB1 bacterium]|nr:biopolymer transporter ExbD [candidate division KSB1 bacterium]
MAYKPSKRRMYEPEYVGLNLFPVMNLLVVLIPLLLSTATFVKLGVIELNLPKAASGPLAQQTLGKESQRSLDLTITITGRGFYLSSSRIILRDPGSGGPTIPVLSNGAYNYLELSTQLFELKQKISSTFFDSKRIILQATRDIEYQILVDTIDAARSIHMDGKQYELFPDVVISAGII